MRQKQVKLSGAFSFKEYVMPKKFTPMQEAFRKEQKRLLRAIQREYRKTGVELDRDLIPQMPNRVTKKALQDIKNIKPRDLRKESQFVDYETGEILDYSQAKDRWQNEQQIAVPYTLNVDDAIIANFMGSLSKYNMDFQNKMRSWLNGLINEYPNGREAGKSAVAQMLHEGAENGVVVTYRIAYSDVMLSEFMADMLDYLPSDVRTKADIMEEMMREIGYEPPE